MGTLVAFQHARLPARPIGLSQARGTVQTLALVLVALTVGSGAVVFSEPAPVDALTVALIVGLPVIGLVSYRPALLAFLGVWIALAGCGVLALTQAYDLAEAAKHMSVTVYLYLAAFTFAAFVARNPKAHAKLILESFEVAALLAATAAIIGTFELVPGAAELFTKFGRASGPFKDPNVFGAFLVLAITYELHQAVSRRGTRALAHFAALGVLTLAVLLSLSRGAWMATGVSVLVYGYLTFVTAPRHLDRAKLIALAGLGCLSLAMIVVAATQFDKFADLLEQRATLTQTYDEGPEGRFGGQEKARDLILESPAGIGALEFTGRHHSEQPHNVYLTMFLNAGWLGGFLYLSLVALTAIWGLRHAFKRTTSQPLFIVAFAALVAIFAEGLLIDTDHWRHFYLLMGLVWGLMAGDRRIVRRPRILADRRHQLLRPVVIIPPPRRPARILGKARRPGALPASDFPRRPPRILAPA